MTHVIRVLPEDSDSVFRVVSRAAIMIEVSSGIRYGSLKTRSTLPVLQVSH